MATGRQIAANRRNARKSTGPRTPAGKAAVRFNPLQHGRSVSQRRSVSRRLGTAGRTWLQIYSQALASSLARELRPAGPLEQFVFRQIVIDAWRLQRARYGKLPEPQRLAYCLRGELTDSRHQTRIPRVFYRSLHELQRLQAQRNAAPSPPPSGPPLTAPDETKNAEQTQSENAARSASIPDPRHASGSQRPAPNPRAFADLCVFARNRSQLTRSQRQAYHA